MAEKWGLPLKEAMLYERVLNGVICNLCARKCIIPNEGSGFFKLKNVEGKLFTTVYGEASIAYVDPIEKKSLFHFNPGSYSYSIGTVSCNFRCKFCVNFSLSKMDEKPTEPGGFASSGCCRDCQA
jgi:pyruvate formate lyase activating enzyme